MDWDRKSIRLSAALGFLAILAASSMSGRHVRNKVRCSKKFASAHLRRSLRRVRSSEVEKHLVPDEKAELDYGSVVSTFTK